MFARVDCQAGELTGMARVVAQTRKDCCRLQAAFNEVLSCQIAASGQGYGQRIDTAFKEGCRLLLLNLIIARGQIGERIAAIVEAVGLSGDSGGCVR